MIPPKLPCASVASHPPTPEMAATSNNKKIILHLCADLGTDSKPYRDAGYDVRCVGEKQDVRTFVPPEGVYGIIANPPCTQFSAARTNSKTPRNLREGMETVYACLRIIWECQYKLSNLTTRKTSLKFWVLENPYTGMLRQFLGEPPFFYSPWEFGDSYTKKTALWGNYIPPPKSSFFFPITNTNFGLMKNSEIHPEFLDTMTRTERRSVCSAKFAQAFFEANQ